MTITKSTIRRQGLKGDLRFEGNLRVKPAPDLIRGAEIAYKAELLGEGAQHSEARPENMGMVNVTIVQGKIMQSIAKIFESIFNTNYSDFSYVDDLAVFVKSERAGNRVIKSITNYLEKKLKVTVNRKKSKVRKVRESAVLGFHIHFKKLRTTEPKVRTKEAINMVLSRKSYWRLSKTLATNCGLSNATFEKEGLISIRELWCKVHHLATAR
ncbi:MAG: hypothetical protein D8M57_06335 [Candidatus Scalindua sp. AMX11]|nr:MAG: hypothetical protein DWQ00_14060 [Candidatus Scalindua sp.]NOG85418.1 hypothetical protein [Planctomycetota bacterium]RZV84011.1 MAG: hypothetical protein EX341_08750 [Candidatus Scalindua sp. SCAELEC01]TDE65704.1 MAG: hypothetical protein D8M57_06335 [Candidatus Scalindua sp. AMX11]GJQ58808.1 MAG: hypothetical protein SCALA701_16090 [Candidatus Scalindua sp.]